MLKHLELTSKQFTMAWQYIVQNQIFYNFFWRLIDGHFENGPSQVTWCDTCVQGSEKRHVKTW